MPYEYAHAARIDDANIVREVIVIPYLNDDDEQITEYCNEIGLAGRWVDCSYTSSRRKYYPGDGFFFDEERNEFVPPGFVLVNNEWVSPQNISE